MNESKDIIFDDIPARAELAQDGECFHVSVFSRETGNELVQGSTLQSISFDTENEARDYFDGLGKI